MQTLNVNTVLKNIFYFLLGLNKTFIIFTQFYYFFILFSILKGSGVSFGIKISRTN